MLERRQMQRGRTFLGGSITFGYQGFTIDCLVKDMSPHGARVIFSDAIPVPSEVDLFIERHGKTRRARFVWRRDQEAGIVFLEREMKSRVVSLEEVS